AAVARIEQDDVARRRHGSLDELEQLVAGLAQRARQDQQPPGLGEQMDQLARVAAGARALLENARGLEPKRRARDRLLVDPELGPRFLAAHLEYDVPDLDAISRLDEDGFARVTPVHPRAVATAEIADVVLAAAERDLGV